MGLNRNVWSTVQRKVQQGQTTNPESTKQLTDRQYLVVLLLQTVSQH